MALLSYDRVCRHHTLLLPRGANILFHNTMHSIYSIQSLSILKNRPIKLRCLWAPPSIHQPIETTAYPRALSRCEKWRIKSRKNHPLECEVLLEENPVKGAVTKNIQLTIDIDPRVDHLQYAQPDWKLVICMYPVLAQRNSRWRDGV